MVRKEVYANFLTLLTVAISKKQPQLQSISRH